MTIPKWSKTSGKRRKICIFATVAAVISIAILFIVLGFTVFRPRHAITIINAFSLGSIQAGNSSFGLVVDLNATLLIDLSITNPNRARFSYPNGGKAEVYYRGTLAGVAAIPPGEIGARETIRLNVTLTVLAGRLIPNSGSVYADFMAGFLPVNTFTRISGKVTVLRIFKIRTVTYTTCDVVVSVSSRSITSSDCKYKTKV